MDGSQESVRVTNYFSQNKLNNIEIELALSNVLLGSSFDDKILLSLSKKS